METNHPNATQDAAAVPTTLRQALAAAAAVVKLREAETLLAHTLGCERAWLLAHPEQELAAKALERFRELVERRVRQEPVQYLTGQQEFYGLPLRVSAAVLIPRPETEHLVEAVLEWARTQPAALLLVDVGTGSGAIVLALAANLPLADLVACDLSTEALMLAVENATALGLQARVQWVKGDLLGWWSEAEAGCVDAIVSNPPYIPATDAASLAAEVREFEPAMALYGGADGLEVYRRLIPQAWVALRPGGLLAMEFGWGQREALVELLEGWSNVRWIEDYAGIPRVVLAKRG